MYRAKGSGRDAFRFWEADAEPAPREAGRSRPLGSGSAGSLDQGS
jgi:hypothetical protein